MALHTLNDLQDRLDQSLGWRRIELLALRSQIESSARKSAESPLARALARAGIALLYAHWEGYVKDSCQAYVDFVAKRRLKFNELNDGLLKISLEHLHKRTSSGDQAAIDALLEAIREPDRSRARIPKDSIVDTKSNLRASVLTQILECIGFDAGRFETKANLIDHRLCDGRNGIAHGRDLFPRATDFVELHAEVVSMLEDVRSMILSAAKMSEYRRSVPATQTPQ